MGNNIIAMSKNINCKVGDDIVIETKINPPLSKTINLPFIVGEKVRDDLTCKEATVIGIEYFDGRKYGSNITQLGSIGVWLDNEYLNGARHPWEVSKLELNDLPLDCKRTNDELEGWVICCQFPLREILNGKRACRKGWRERGEGMDMLAVGISEEGKLLLVRESENYIEDHEFFCDIEDMLADDWMIELSNKN
jgi:hypothetical protein